MKTKMLIVVALVLVVGYYLFVKKKGCSCKGTKCTCGDKKKEDAPADTTEGTAETTEGTAETFVGSDTAYANMYSGRPSKPSRVSTDTAYTSI
jgi:hypothetical protein